MIDTATRLHNRPEGSGLTALALAAGQDPEVVATWLTGVLADFGHPIIDHARLVAYLTHQATPTVELMEQPPAVERPPAWVYAALVGIAFLALVAYMAIEGLLLGH